MHSKPSTEPMVWLGLHNPHDANDINGAVAVMQRSNGISPLVKLVAIGGLEYKLLFAEDALTQ